MKYPCYPEYGDPLPKTRVSFPKDWKVERLRFSIQSNPIKSEIKDRNPDELVTFVPMEAVGEYGGIDTTQEKPLGDVYSGYTYFADNDILVAKITPCFENGKGAIAEGLKNDIGFGTTEFHVLRPLEGISARWLFYLTLSDSFRGMGTTEMLGAGGQKRVPESFIRDFRTGIPSLTEQEQIADFLDYKTAQIDALVAKKRELIEKLNERRTAIITQAITKGLDPSAPMRESGVDWLGRVPEPWEVRRLKFTASEPLKYGANEAADLDDRDLPRYIRITDIREDGTLNEETFRSLLDETAEPYLLQDGDILLARSGATVGKSFQYLNTWGRAAYAGYLIRFRVDPAVLIARYASYFMRTECYWACINSTLIQATIQNFSAEKYANIYVPLPPLEEQKQIVAEIEEQKERLDELENAARQVIDRLTEYRTALITAATTGKIDVQNIKLGK